MIKTLKTKMEKMQELINKDLELLKNKHKTYRDNTITEIKIHQKDSIAEYLKQKND